MQWLNQSVVSTTVLLEEVPHLVVVVAAPPGTPILPIHPAVSAWLPIHTTATRVVDDNAKCAAGAIADSTKWLVSRSGQTLFSLARGRGYVPPGIVGRGVT